MNAGYRKNMYQGVHNIVAWVLAWPAFKRRIEQGLVNKDSDDGFIYYNDDMQTASQRPDRTELRPNSVPSKSVFYIFNFERSRVSRFRYR